MKLAVLFLNLGGPASLKEVRPFLVNLFSDPDVLPLPFFQKPLAQLIAFQRKRRSQSYYRAIGGGSPLQRITQDQAKILEEKLKERFSEVKVYVAMRYSKPTTEEAWEQIIQDQMTHLLILPLYPQCSMTTTVSSIKELRAVMAKKPYSLEQKWLIHSWFDHPLYIDVWAKKISLTLQRLPSEYHQGKVDVVFSAHSIPVKYVEKGDVYQDQIKDTVRKIIKKLSHPEKASHPERLVRRSFSEGGSEGSIQWYLSYQSKLGPIAWLEPSTLGLLKTLSKQNPKRAIVMVPISFVSDHVETLYEIDILYKKEAQKLGIPYFTRVESLNTAPEFITVLEDLVVKRVSV
ncbi:MAG: ferrochelatase [Deltaproteobacteria bacterium GWA2_38_16]|nr:MAG: ferrochelatase [Deltaproteobacteria bacterium GWA2_38_16]OGQ03618.1 MAG: ferrochelatase [Deltaproteobacteria bacterium RIFCSPHIGHO2_02_FULL_38_15]OGQ35032.1 MAG: ferrochelatase [Deltaproteobacteria bacterium RIFCSPLOWO2_01_FULL_38_9]OGQ61313.1 MAG: ferrochelatase [Deltaproteobacteria bacterium RIFCSPLOWO2_12_FULL_38_8]